MHEDPPPPSTRELAVVEVVEAALVLGSTQDPATFDVGAVERAGLTWCRRRSGGGSVLLIPGEHLWVDITLPRDDPWWTDDVGAAAVTVGEWWADLLGVGEVWRGAYEPGPLGRQVCFAGIGPGEVVVGERKLVGIAQRRNRERARFQCIIHGRFRAAEHLGLLAEPGDGADAQTLDASVGVTDVSAVVDRLTRLLPDA